MIYDARIGLKKQESSPGQALPGVEAAGLVDALPLGTNRTWGTRVVDKEYGDDRGDYFFPHIVDAGYLPRMEIPLSEGRYFTRDEFDKIDVVDALTEWKDDLWSPASSAILR